MGGCKKWRGELHLPVYGDWGLSGTSMPPPEKKGLWRGAAQASLGGLGQLCPGRKGIPVASVLVKVHPASSRENPVLNRFMQRKEMCHLKSQQVESRDSGLVCLEIGFPSVPLGVKSILRLELG